jgi:hypothetical protein
MDSFLQKWSETTTAHFGHRRAEFLANCTWLDSASSVPAFSLAVWLEESVDGTSTLPDGTFLVVYVPERQNGDADVNPDVRLFI